MNYRFDDSMKKKIITYASVALIAILLFFSFYQMNALKSFIRSLISLLSPFILGIAIAFLLNKPMMFVENQLIGSWKLKAGHKRTIAALCALVMAIAAVTLFFWLIIPQLLSSTLSLIESFPSYLEDFQSYVNQLIAENHIDLSEIEQIFGDWDIFQRLTQLVTNALPKMAQMSYSFMNTLLDIVLGIMSALYIMLDKEKLCRHLRIAVYALFPQAGADYLVHISEITMDIFNNFIIGKAIDSLIIGVLCYLGMTFLQLPYAILLSVIVAITNMIPVFGPFIGAVPGVFILLIIHPIDAVYFALFILVLQQFDGNVLGPLILGDKLGLPSLWILFAVCVGGGVFGVIGMFVGVPVFAVLYALIKEFLAYRLKQKNLRFEDFQAPQTAAVDQKDSTADHS